MCASKIMQSVVEMILKKSTKFAEDKVTVMFQYECPPMVL